MVAHRRSLAALAVTAALLVGGVARAPPSPSPLPTVFLPADHVIITSSSSSRHHHHVMEGEASRRAGPRPRNPKCTCTNATLCESLPPPTAGLAQQRAEVLAFYSGEAYGANGSEWREFDWTKTTAIGMYDGKAAYNYGELQCVAHAHGARILDWNVASDTFGTLGFGRRDPDFLGNATAVAIYADFMANYVSSAGIDGIILDIETGNTGSPSTLKALREGNTALTCAVKKALVAKAPGAVLTWAMPLRVTDHDAYDYKAIMECGADWLTPMAYEVWSGSKGSPTLTGPAFASPTVTSDQIRQGITAYKQLGVEPSQLVVALFWGGTEFMCNNTAGFWSVPGQVGCRLSDRMQSAGPEVGSGQVAQLLAQSTQLSKWKQPPPDGFTGKKHDEATGTLYFRAPGGATAQNDANCINCCPPCGPGSKPGGVMQPFRVNPSYYFTEIWYDDGKTIAAKYQTVRDVGARGIAFWTAGSTQMDPAVIADMWDAVPHSVENVSLELRPAVKVLKTDDGTSSGSIVADACSKAAQMQVNYVDAMTHILPGERGESDVDVSGREVDAVMLSAARQQRVDFQLELRPSAGAQARNLTLSTTEPTHVGVSPAIRLVSSVNVTMASNAAKRVGLWPDPLSEPTTVELLPMDSLPTVVWVTLAVPATAAADAAMTGHVTITDAATKQQLCKVPYIVKVHDFTVPNASQASQSTDAQLCLTYAVPENHSYTPVPAFADWDTWNLAVRNGYTKMLDNRVNAAVFGGVFPHIELDISSDFSHIEINTTLWDAQVEWLLARGVRTIRFPKPMGCGPGMLKCGSNDPVPGAHKAEAVPEWNFTPDLRLHMFKPVNLDKKPPCELNPQFVKVFRSMFGKVVEHLKAKGWLKNTMAVIMDEPGWNDALTLCEWTAMAKLFKSLDPNMRIWQDRWPASYTNDTASILALVDTWIPDPIQYDADLAAIYRQAEKGTTFYSYDNAVPVIDLSPIRTRSFFWKIWRTNYVNGKRAAGLSGSLSWYGISDWQLDPWAEANAPFPKQPGARPAGLGVLMYPPWPGGSLLDGLISSKRWEMVRAGLEDVEYFAMLLDKLETVRTLCTTVTAAAASPMTRFQQEEAEPAAGVAAANSICSHSGGGLATAENALNRVDEVVWGWAITHWVETPGHRRWNVTEPYTQNCSLVHDVLDNVAVEIEKADSAIGALRQLVR